MNGGGHFYSFLRVTAAVSKKNMLRHIENDVSTLLKTRSVNSPNIITYQVIQGQILNIQTISIIEFKLKLSSPKSICSKI